MMPLQKDVLQRYVENGGVLVMSAPQWTTRLDRDSVNYTAADLIQPFGRITIGNPTAVAGKLGGKDVTLDLATVALGPASEVVETLGGKLGGLHSSNAGVSQSRRKYFMCQGSICPRSRQDKCASQEST